MPLQCADYKVGWLCALPLEKAVAIAGVDERHEPPFDLVADRNSYSFGRIGCHNIVITVLPSGKYGTNAAASVATNLSNSFPALRFGLMVGIGGGAPSTAHDIRLGDVVVSRPGPGHPGVMQHDFGKIEHDRVTKTAILHPPPMEVLTAISTMEAFEIVGEGSISDFINGIVTKNPGKFTNPGTKHDILYQAEYPHPGGDTCAACDQSRIKSRPDRRNVEPVIHYGLIASGNSVIKDAKTRDRLGKEHGILCYEMEAAGIMDILQCLVIRGICDYSDSHKNKNWQGYAATTAAAYAKRLLLSMSSSTSHRRTTIPSSAHSIYSPRPISPPISPYNQTGSTHPSGPKQLPTPPTSPSSNPYFGRPETSNNWQKQPYSGLDNLAPQLQDVEGILEAAKGGDISRVRQFVENGGDPNTMDTAFNTTLLHYMAQRGEADMTKFLLKSGANPNTSSKFSTNTPLIDAARNGHRDIVQCLLQHGADPTVCGEFKRTALHMAADEGNFACVVVLVEHGADPRGMDEDGDTPLALAQEEDYDGIVRYLREL
ncbi:hypothetical protein EMCG_03516 [[Emmonsia] crescens]|uniref:Uncharacterized protein n=1 Tax=[Emmonsia] crescens TaxID=73230 RepID=A0A0G2J062_9EURO|nr:hypothetical protein EMCG_03516 [Emmonsia crescens UAMH 3008]